jgi:hypothetical protein
MLAMQLRLDQARSERNHSSGFDQNLYAMKSKIPISFSPYDKLQPPWQGAS